MTVLYHEFEKSLNKFLALAKLSGLNVGVHCGYRSFKEQDVLFNKRINGKRVTKAPGGLSWHNYGVAADVVFLENGKWSWAEKHDWKKLGDLGKSCGLEWGGDWKSFPDRPHFQLTKGFSIREALNIFKKFGLEHVWQKIGGLK